MKNEPLKGKAQGMFLISPVMTEGEEVQRLWQRIEGESPSDVIEVEDLRSAVSGLKSCFVHNYSPHLEKCQVCGKNADVFFAKPIPNSIPPMQELPEMCLNCWADKWFKCWDD